jgi:chromate transport protein ChrA
LGLIINTIFFFIFQIGFFGYGGGDTGDARKDNLFIENTLKFE